jgi:SAM-dependent methyltransferase
MVRGRRALLGQTLLMIDTDANQPRRHPSAGNVGVAPRVVSAEEAPDPLPTLSFPHGDDRRSPAIRFGPGLDDGSLQKLVGPLDGSRILDLGCGSGGAAIAMARAGARVIAVEPSTTRLARARSAAELADVHVEFHHSDLADLPYVRADSIDSALAVYSLSQVQDLPRVFRQLHRVLSTDAPLVIALPHPTTTMLEWDPEEQDSPWMWRSHWSDQPIAWRVAGDEGTTHVHQIGDVFTALVRSNFRVDTLLEPAADPGTDSLHRDRLHQWSPPTLVIRGRKLGT